MTKISRKENWDVTTQTMENNLFIIYEKWKILITRMIEMKLSSSKA